LFFLPLMFLPDLGFRRSTAFGTLGIGDYLIFPYIVLLLVAKGQPCPRFSKGLRLILIAFLAWTLIGVVSINIRYPYDLDYSAMNFSLFKIAKLALYGLAGILTMKRMRDSIRRRDLCWSLLGVVAVLAISLLLGPGKDIEVRSNTGYINHNAISVTAAILVSYCGGLLVCGYGSRRWKWVAQLIVVIGLTGILVSQGRGGWVATIFAIAYVAWRRGLSSVTVALVAGFLVLGFVSYRMFPEFQKRLDFTVNPELRYQTGETPNETGIDSGGRVEIWLWEGRKFIDATFWGTGFFHRGGSTRINPNGSHNFFIQMFLETGLFGGLLVLLAFGRMWVDAGSREAQQALLTTPLRAALIAAFVGGMGGEYYYGGIPVLALFLVYAPTGALPAMRRARVVSYVGGMVRSPVEVKRRA